MPRYRTIQCEHCGFYQLKRDETCDQCGAPTARAIRRDRFDMIRFGLGIVMVVGFFLYVRHVIPGSG